MALMTTPTTTGALSWTVSTRKQIALVFAAVAVAASIGGLSLALTTPEPIASAALSGPWQCTKTAGIVTVCTKKPG